MNKRITLDNPEFIGKLRSYERSRAYVRPPTARRPLKQNGPIRDVSATTSKPAKKLATDNPPQPSQVVVKLDPQPLTKPAQLVTAKAEQNSQQPRQPQLEYRVSQTPQPSQPENKVDFASLNISFPKLASHKVVIDSVSDMLVSKKAVFKKVTLQKVMPHEVTPQVTVQEELPIAQPTTQPVQPAQVVPDYPSILNSNQQAEPKESLKTDKETKKKRNVFKIKELLKATKRRNLFKPNTLLYTAACIVFVFGMAVAFDGLITNHKADAQVKQIVTQGSNNKPKPEKPKPDKKSATSTYKVAPGLPKYIDIPSLGVHASVFAMGVDSKGTLIAPSSLYNAGWYNKSSAPGQAGGSLVEGHSGIGGAPGIFHDLNKLTPGSLIKITRGDNRVLIFKVVKQKTYDVKNVDMASMMVSQDSSKPGLNLISCVGDVAPGTTEFTHRIIVYAVLQ